MPSPAFSPKMWVSGSGHEQHVVGGDQRRLDRRELVEVGEQRPGREHRALGPPAGAARVEQHGELLAAAVALRVGAVRGAGQQRARPPAASRCSAARESPRMCSTSARGVGRVDRHGDQPGPQRAEVEDDEVGAGAQLQRDPVARARGRRRCRARAAERDPPVELAAGQPRGRPSTSAEALPGRVARPARAAGRTGPSGAARRHPTPDRTRSRHASPRTTAGPPARASNRAWRTAVPAQHRPSVAVSTIFTHRSHRQRQSDVDIQRREVRRCRVHRTRRSRCSRLQRTPARHGCAGRRRARACAPSPIWSTTHWPPWVRSRRSPVRGVRPPAIESIGAQGHARCAARAPAAGARAAAPAAAARRPAPTRPEPAGRPSTGVWRRRRARRDLAAGPAGAGRRRRGVRPALRPLRRHGVPLHLLPGQRPRARRGLHQRDVPARAAPHRHDHLPGPRHRRLVRHHRPQHRARPPEVRPAPAGDHHRRHHRGARSTRRAPRPPCSTRCSPSS